MKWKIVMIVILAFVFVFGTIAFVNNYSKFNDVSYRQNKEQEYVKAFEDYSRKKNNLENRIVTLEETIERSNDDIDTNILLLIDPYNVNTLKLSYYVDTGYMIIPELSYQNTNFTSLITSVYKNEIDNYNWNLSYSNEFNGKNIINPVPGNNVNVVSSSIQQNSILQITIIATSETDVEYFERCINVIISKTQEKINEVVDEHSIALISRENSNEINTDLKNMQDQFYSLLENNIGVLESTKQELDELVEPKKEVITLKDVIKNSVKAGLLGFVIGMLATLFISICVDLYLDKLSNIELLEDRTGINVLGVVKSDKKDNCIERIAKKGLGIIETTRDNSYDYIAEVIRLNCASQSIILIGQEDKIDMNNITDIMRSKLANLSISEAGDILSNPNTLKAVNGKEVILVEKWNKTKMHTILLEKARIISGKGTVLGMIILE